MDAIYEILPGQVRQAAGKEQWLKLQPEEIRFRINMPLLIEAGGGEWYIDAEKNSLQPGGCQAVPKEALVVRKEMLSELINGLSRNSMYAYQNEMQQGFFTYQGGHRIGICGKAVSEQGKIKGVTGICYINIRIAREYPGCAVRLLPYLHDEKGQYLSTLIFSVPGAGKTTLLRDCIRLLSNGCGSYRGKKISIVDERGEIAGCFHGIPQREIGMRTDVLDGGKKSEAMLYLLRSMSPEIIATDELGGPEDYEALQQMVHSGCFVLATVHASCADELTEKEQMKRWITEKKFRRFVQVEKKPDGSRQYFVYDEDLKRIC